VRQIKIETGTWNDLIGNRLLGGGIPIQLDGGDGSF
jgi:hypothetical protein